MELFLLLFKWNFDVDFFKCVITSFFIFLETPWLLYGIIIGLSVGYVMLIVGGILYGFIKLGRWIRTRVLTGLERRRQHSEPTIIQLRQLQENLNQA